MLKLKVKKGDKVVVLAGSSKGAVGEVKQIIKNDPKNVKVLVEGVNVKTKHVKPTQTSPGGIEKVEAPINISNVALVDPKTGKATRVSLKTVGENKVRVASASGEQID